MDIMERTSLEMATNTTVINVLEKEIEYARSQIRPQATGHIYTAISWMENRLEQLKNENTD